MRPVVLKGHERPLTQIKFNRESDLVFTAAKDMVPCAWYTATGERLGTFNGHQGAVWTLDVNYDTTRLLTGSSDTSARIWDCETGKQLCELKHEAMVRSVMWANGDRMVLTVQDQAFSKKPTIFIYNVADDPADQDPNPVRAMTADEIKIKMGTALWGGLNETIISGGDDGCIRVWDVEKGVQINKIQAHRQKINNIQFSPDRTMLITASADHSAKVFDVKTMTQLKSFEADRPLNSAAISPIMNHVIIGGGQEAMNVTTTDARVGHFEVDFYHLVYQEKLDVVKGHFGPVNTVAFAPDGKSFASGAEDGYVRLYHFDTSYFKSPNY